MSYLLAALSGLLMAVQGSFNAILSREAGLAETTFIVHIIGTAVAGGYLLFSGTNTAVSKWFNAPWYAYLGGVLSLFIIYLVAAQIASIGAANATTAIIVGQVLTAVVIDWLGFGGLKHFSFSWYQPLGVLLLAIGAKLLMRS